MKITIVLSRLENGGLERVQSNLAWELHARGYDLTIVAGRVKHRHPGDFPDDVRVVEIARSSKWLFPVGLYRFLRRESPDCVYTTSNDVAWLTLLIKRLWFRNTRVIVTQHLSITGPIALAKGAARAKLLINAMLMRRTLGMADEIIAVTHDVAADLASTARLPLSDVRVIHNPIIGPGFDQMLSAPAVQPWAVRTFPTLVFAGRLSPEKRTDLLLDAFIALRRTHEARLVILGDGPLREQLQARIESEGLAGACVMTGFVSNVLPLIREADVLVLPSDYEGFGNVLVEAMACGVQVVATDCPHGPSEVLEGGRYGQLVPPGDVAELEAAIRRSVSGEFFVDPALLRIRAAQFGTAAATDKYLDAAHAAAEAAPDCQR